MSSHVGRPGRMPNYTVFTQRAKPSAQACAIDYFVHRTMPGPILRIAGSDDGILDHGTTVRELREIYPGCYVKNGNNLHVRPDFVLQE